MKAIVGRDGPTELLRALEAQTDYHIGARSKEALLCPLRPFVHMALVLLFLLLAPELLLDAEGHQNISTYEDNRQSSSGHLLNAKHSLEQAGPLPPSPILDSCLQFVTKRRKGAKAGHV